MRNYKWISIYSFFVLALLVLAYYTPFVRENLLHWLLAVGSSGRVNYPEACVVFFFISAVLAFLAFPSMPLIYIAAGYCLGPSLGGFVSIIGSSLGAVCAFLLFREQISHRLQQLGGERHSTRIWLMLLGLRLSPIVPAVLVNLVAVLFNVSAMQHLLITAIGSAPLILFYAQLGQQGLDLLAGNALHWTQFSGYSLLIAVSSLLTFVGPWRPFLKSIEQLNEDVAAYARSPTAGGKA
jgi:uncharacterized membrane protein YdjX (TVP38/TMEM64 family)